MTATTPSPPAAAAALAFSVPSTFESASSDAFAADSAPRLRVPRAERHVMAGLREAKRQPEPLGARPPDHRDVHGAEA